MKCKTLLIVPPQDRAASAYPPYGALYIGTYLKNKGYEVQVLNLDLERISLKEVLKRIKEYAPDVIGFSAIVSHAYKPVKEMSWAIKNNFPNIFMLMGGQLSYAAKVVLQNTPIDLIVLGEGENTIISLYDYLQNNNDRKDITGKAYKEKDGKWVCESQNMKWLGQIKGIAYKETNGEIIYTEEVTQIKNIDDLPIPNYDLIDMESYLCSGQDRYASFCVKDPRFYEPHRKDKTAFTIMTGRGCQAKCSFCSRGMRGLRKHSPEYILNSMEYLIKHYNVGYFTFGDESFISSKRWVLEFLKKLKERKLDIMFFIQGARVDIIDRELIFALKDAGCFMIQYGYETGSQRMLDTIEKRASITETYRTHMLTVKEAGIVTVPGFIIGLPGETNETIAETIQFIKSLDLDEPLFKVNYAQALPGSPLYEYARLKGFIDDEDEYLSNVNNIHPDHTLEAFESKVLLNFSEQPMKEVLVWGAWMWQEIRNDCKKRKNWNENDTIKFMDKTKTKKSGGLLKSGGNFRNFIRKFVRKSCKKIKIFGKEFFVYYPVPAYFRDSLIRKLTKKYLNGSSENSELHKIIKIEDEIILKQLGKPLKRGDDGEVIDAKIVKNGSFMRCYQAKYGNLDVKRYEPLRVLNEDIRKTSKKNVGYIEIGMLPMDRDAL